MIIGMHALLLRAGCETHRHIFNGASEKRNHVSFEMGEDDKPLRVLKNIGHLHGPEMIEPGGNIHKIAAVHAVGDNHRTTQKVMRVAVGGGRYERVFGRTASAGIENRCIKNKRFGPVGGQPGSNFLA